MYDYFYIFANMISEVKIKYLDKYISHLTPYLLNIYIGGGILVI